METLRDEVDEISLKDPREIENSMPLEKVTPISIYFDYPDYHVMIGTKLIEELRKALVAFLKKNYDVSPFTSCLPILTILQFAKREESLSQNA